MLNAQEDACTFYSEVDGIGSCELQFFGRPLKKQPADVLDEQWHYFQGQCVKYPEAEFTVAKGIPLPQGCGYSWEAL
jgi:hypothetical protein